MKLRDARNDDYAFAEVLYVACMQPLLTALDAWDEEFAIARFKDHYKTDEVSIVVIDGTDAGWIQLSTTDHEIHIDQLYLMPDFRGRGIGTQLIRDVLATAASENKSVHLSLVRNNRAFYLYRRLGFRTLDEDSVRLHMCWDPADLDGTDLGL